MAIECGLESIGGGPITWQEIQAWQQCTGESGIWYAKVIKALSHQYIREYEQAKDRHRQPPMQGDVTDRREEVSRQFHAFVRSKA